MPDSNGTLEPAVLYVPDEQAAARSQLRAFIRYCEDATEQSFFSYGGFDQFAVAEWRRFWALFLQWSNIIRSGDPDPVCIGDDCETAEFFPNIRLNYTENLLCGNHGGVIGCHAGNGREVLHRHGLRQRVTQLASALRRLGVQPGDRVVAIARNNVEVVIAALAAAAIGAVFSSCAHDMGAFTIVSRFQRLEPTILFANFAGKPWDAGEPMSDRVSEVIAALPSLTAVITLDGVKPDLALPVYSLERLLAEGAAEDFVWQRFPFRHPLFVMFSSGTTGLPKCIVHSTGGTLLEHVKEHRLHGDLSRADSMFFQTSCGWMMWNWQLSALACGANIVLYDGGLSGPDTLWKIVAEQHVTVFGTNPAYVQFARAAGYAPDVLDLTALRAVLSTGSILYPKQFDWIVNHVKPVPVQSISGGTDIIGCFVLGNPLLPIYSGCSQCRSLGLDVRALPEPVGELICANPFPSRPVGFYGEATNERFHQAYFAQNPGVWTHGDLIEVRRQGVTMLGRSDGVLNIRGVRIGPAEIYRILERIPEILQAMAVELTREDEPGGAALILLAVLRGDALTDATIRRIRAILLAEGNAMMVPAAVIQMSELPVTHSGKLSEAAARDAVNGRPIGNRSALRNPDCLDGLQEKLQASLLGGETPERYKHEIAESDLERILIDICRRALRVPDVSLTDNFLALGGDSLCILGFLMELAARTRTRLPLCDLIGVSTLAELANLLRAGRAAPSRDSAAPQVRPFEARDRAEVCRLLDEGFKAPAGAKPWHHIFDHTWQWGTIPRGFVLTCDGVIVGFIGLICAMRSVAGKSGPVCNLTSWFVRPAYRGWSASLLAAATGFEQVTYTSLTPNPASQRIFKAIGFAEISRTKRILPPMSHPATIFGPRPSILFGASVPPLVDREHQRILADHDCWNCLPVLVTVGEESALIIARRRLFRESGMLPCSDILYCSDPALLQRHVEPIKLALMWRQRTLAMGVSQHVVPGLSGGIAVSDPMLARSTLFAAHEIDQLYSEFALLPI
jgi:acetoacetyl-CoA synthetase